MAARADEKAEDLRDDLIHEIAELCGDLKHLGYEYNHIPEILKGTRALALNAQITKPQKQRVSMQKTKTHKQADRVEKIVQSVAHVDQQQDKRWRKKPASLKQYGEFNCLVLLRAHTYETLARVAEFLFVQLTEE